VQAYLQTLVDWNCMESSTSDGK